MSIIILSISDCIEGNYIPFGVFNLYNDNCLESTLAMYIQFVIRTPFNQLSVFLILSSL